MNAHARTVRSAPLSTWSAWASVLSLFPGAGPIPPVHVVRRAVPAEPGGKAGWYYPDEHTIHILDDGDHENTLATLIHELAHAWSPVERLHHGDRWANTYLRLMAWMFGVAPVSVDDIVTHARARGWDREPGCTSRRRLIEFALDVECLGLIIRERPTLTIKHRGDGTDLAVAVGGQVLHWTTLPNTQIPTAAP